MRAEKLEELNDYIRELQTVKKTLVASEYIFDEKNVKGSKKYLFYLKNNLFKLLQKNMPIKRKGFMDVEKYMVELANGMVVPREKIIKGGGDKSAAIVMPVTKDNNTILVVQSRSSTKESVCVEFPAGYIEEDRLERSPRFFDMGVKLSYDFNLKKSVNIIRKLNILIKICYN